MREEEIDAKHCPRIIKTVGFGRESGGASTETMKWTRKRARCGRAVRKPNAKRAQKEERGRKSRLNLVCALASGDARGGCRNA